MENHFLPVNYLHVSLPHKSCRFTRHNNLLSKSTRHLSIKGEAVGVCVCLGKVGGWMVEDGFSEEVGEHWGKQIFSLACDSTVKTHSWCWCVLEVSRANISTALQWQSGVVGMLVCVYVMGGVYWAAVLCNTSGFQKNGLPQNNNIFIYKITFFSQRRKLKITL